MNLIERWPHLQRLAEAACTLPGLEVWLFGSALRHEDPNDLDVLLVYDDRQSVVALRELGSWEEYSPPCEVIAMTRLEVSEYDFISTTGAVRLV